MMAGQIAATIQQYVRLFFFYVTLLGHERGFQLLVFLDQLLILANKPHVLLL